MQMSLGSNITKMYLVRFFTSLFFVSAVTIPFFQDFGHLNFTQIFILQSFFVICALIMEVPTGAFADKFGRKISIVFSCFVVTLGAIVYSSFPNFYVFMLGEFLWAVAAAFYSGADSAILYDSLEKNKRKLSKKIFSRYSAIGSLGFVIAAPIGSIIAATTEVRITMLISSLSFFTAGLIALKLKEPEIRRRGVDYLRQVRDGINFLIKNKALRVLAIDFAIVNLLTYFILLLNQPMMKKAGLDMAYWGFVLAGTNLISIFLLLKLHKIEKKVKPRRFLFITTLIPGIMFLISGLNNFLILIILSIYAIFISRLLREPLFQHYMNKHIKSNQRATVLSAVDMVGGLMIAIVNPFVGILADRSLDYTLIMIGAAAILFAFISRVEEKMLKD